MNRNSLPTALVAVLLCICLGWAIAFKLSEPPLPRTHRFPAIYHVVSETPAKPKLLAGAIGGGVVGLFFAFLILRQEEEFSGAPYLRFLRGTRQVRAKRLAAMCSERNQRQIMVGPIPMPTRVETTHLLAGGATGTGKTVLMKGLIHSALSRGDRAVILDPNGEFYATFGTPKDKLLNPYDARTQGWSFFNEIRADQDFHAYAKSLVPEGETANAEEWAGYGRLLIREAARKLDKLGQRSVKKLFEWTTIRETDDLRAFLSGTLAESLFAGSNEASRALTSARFVLSNKLPEHLQMPEGTFSIRDWLDDENSGNLFITWREDMAVAMKPLMSTWTDCLFVAFLSRPKQQRRQLWTFLDEIASLEKLPSLKNAATKGRQHGLSLVACLQSTAQLDEIYGAKGAQILRSCFRSLVVLGGSKTDPQTCEDMSKSLGSHEVLREENSDSVGARGASRNRSTRATPPERVVSASHISSMADLEMFVAFAGDLPIAKAKLEVQPYIARNEPFVERTHA